MGINGVAGGECLGMASGKGNAGKTTEGAGGVSCTRCGGGLGMATGGMGSTCFITGAASGFTGCGEGGADRRVGTKGETCGRCTNLGGSVLVKFFRTDR